MSRRPASDPVTPYTIDGATYKIAASTLTHLPGAVAFIGHLRRKGISSHVAGEYARLAAKALRNGYAGNPERIVARAERTAVNAYWMWTEIAYQERVRPVLQALAAADVRTSLPWLRVGSVVPPTPGKRIPRLLRPAQLALDEVTHTAKMIPAEVGWVDTTAWTLHLPQKACAVHTDPCDACVPVELDAVQLETIAKAFEGAWGHRDIARVPRDCFLFGQPPREGTQATYEVNTLGSIVALLPSSALADTLRQMRGYVTQDEDAFRSRLSDGEADVVVMSREMAGKHYPGLLHTVREAWDKDTEAVRVAALDALSGSAS